MKVSLARYGKPSSTAALQARPLFGETDGVWAVTTYLEKGRREVPLDKKPSSGVRYTTVSSQKRTDEDKYRVHPRTESRRLVQGGRGHAGKITSERTAEPEVGGDGRHRYRPESGPGTPGQREWYRRG